MTNESTPAERVRAHFEAGAKRLKATSAKATTTEPKAAKDEAPKKA